MLIDIDERLLAHKPISVTLNFDWENTTLDERAQMRWDYIQEQKKKDPNFVGYDFPEHFNSMYGGRAKFSENVSDQTKLISTLGEIISIWNFRLFTSFGWNTTSGYRDTQLKVSGKDIQYRVHRIVACTFIPVPEHLKEVKNTIMINHKNDVKYSNLLSNLEWCTGHYNTLTAIKTSARKTKSFKLTVTIPCKLKGNVYYFFSEQCLHKHKFTVPNVKKSIKTNTVYLCGIWEEVSKQEITNKSIGMGESDLAIIRDECLGSYYTLGTVGTIVTEGPCKGERFVLFGNKELKKYGFNPSNVIRSIKEGRRICGSCTWERMTREECINIPIGLTEAQKEHIKLV